MCCYRPERLCSTGAGFSPTLAPDPDKIEAVFIGNTPMILTHQHQTLLKDAVQHAPRSVTRRRAQALLLFHEGYPANKVAALSATSRSTVYAWRQRWHLYGPAMLSDLPRSGRPLKGGARYQRDLEEALAHDPDELGYPFRAWTVQRLREHLARETGITLSDGRMRALLQRMGYRYQRHTRRWPGEWVLFFRKRIYLDRLEPFWTWKPR
jgi:transposase